MASAPLSIAQLRCHHQRLSGSRFTKATEVVHWLGAVQSQDYASAKWALGLRATACDDAAVERAFNTGDILRTHLLRPTWHFVTPADIRWLLELTAPRVQQINAPMYRKLGLDAGVLARSDDALVQALRDGAALDRDQLRDVLQRAGVPTEGDLRLSYLLMHAELRGLICSGPRLGKQFTYMLMEKRVPAQRALSRDEALVALARRYFFSRGPATPNDLARWSGLTLTDARKGLASIHGELEQVTHDGTTYWQAPMASAPAKTPAALLLSIYDEYISGYKDRSAVISDSHARRLGALGNALTHIIVLDGQVVGTWKRTFRSSTVSITTELFIMPTVRQLRDVEAAIAQYGDFTRLTAEHR